MPGDTDDFDPAVLEQFERWAKDREDKAAAEAARAKPPRNFAEFMDRIADRVWERGEERAAERRRKDEDDDQAPTRGEPKGFMRGIQSWYDGGHEEAG